MFWPVTLLGAVLGWLLASIPGALLGALLGQVLDRRLGLSSWRGLRDRLRGRPALAGSELLFVLLGRLAKSGGRVTPAHIQAARMEMLRCRLDDRGERAAIKAFGRGKQGEDDLRRPLSALSGDREQGRALLQACWRLARAGGQVPPPAHRLILQWGGWMGWESDAVAALDAQRRREPPSRPATGAYQAAMKLLGVSEATDADGLKRAYRRLLSRHHPDKLAGAGASAAQVREATERTRELHAAYELVLQRRGLR